MSDKFEVVHRHRPEIKTNNLAKRMNQFDSLSVILLRTAHISTAFVYDPAQNCTSSLIPFGRPS